LRASRIILLSVALLAAGLAAYFFMATLNAPTQQAAVEAPARVIEEKKDRVLVARTPIGVGQRLGEDNVEWQSWPESALRPEYLTQTALPDAPAQMKDAIARFEFFPGEPILEAKLVHSTQGYMSAILPSGMRAVSVEVSAASASGGFIFPNDRVDLVLTRSDGGTTLSEPLLENVKVLAINRRLGEAGTTGAPSDPDNPKADVFQDSVIATLELDPSQGQIVINGTRLGTISLVLRSIADYAQTAAAEPRSTTNRPIRMIRFGRNQDVMSGAGGELASASYRDDGR